jgi:hypothetical protein
LFGKTTASTAHSRFGFLRRAIVAITLSAQRFTSLTFTTSATSQMMPMTI